MAYNNTYDSQPVFCDLHV